MRRILWLCLTGLFSLLAWMTQVGPDDVVSNLAKWYDRMAAPPQWLKNPSLDTIWSVAFGAMALLSLVTFFVPDRFFTRRKKPLRGSTGGISRETAVALGIEPKPRYAAPGDAAKLDIRTTTYKELGKRAESVGRDVQRFNGSVPYDARGEDVISQFHKRMAPHVLGSGNTRTAPASGAGRPTCSRKRMRASASAHRPRGFPIRLSVASRS